MIINRLRNSAFMKDTALTFITQIIVMLLSFIANKILAVNLGVADFGIFNIAKRGGTVISFILIMGMGISIPRYLSMNVTKNKNIGTKYFSSAVLIILVNSVLAIIIGSVFFKQISVILFGTNNYSNLSIPIVIFAIGMTMNTFIYAAFRGSGLYVLFSISQVIGQFLVTCSIFIGPNVRSIILLWGIISIMFPLFLTIGVVLRGEHKYDMFQVRFKVYKHELKELIVYGVPRILGEIIQFSYYLIPLIIINKIYSAQQAGIFSAATGILQIFLPFFSYLGLILLPYVSTSIANKNFKNVDRRITQLIFIYLFVALIAIIFGYIFTDFLLKLLYSTDFINSAGLVRILLFTLAPKSIFLLLRNPIDAISKIPYNTLLLLLSVIVLLMGILNATSITFIAWSFVISDALLAIGSILIWSVLKRKYRFNYGKN
ncbi:lipopolysaccharide biosynthesis protein [Weissella cibaria]|uniref:lipopolysaccharide biosynthesis protein n=1 Tax=Weissella cibaria TaxID=137591 RepID=UPI0015F674F3|nr:lipopolysaccharide biosynthesis protein [Weissella cibaria]QMU89611.1 lipopolysaccharide biosynthesis protein [Weissella cibaria]